MLEDVPFLPINSGSSVKCRAPPAEVGDLTERRPVDGGGKDAQDTALHGRQAQEVSQGVPTTASGAEQRLRPVNGHLAGPRGG